MGVPGRRMLLTAYGIAAVAHLLALALGLGPAAVVTKLLLVPLLLTWVLRGRPQPRLLLVGLVFAWLGDVALEVPGDTAFLLGLLTFLVMQLCYVAGFVRLGVLPRLRRSWWIPLGYLLLWCAVNVALGPSLGNLRGPILVYSVFLAAMAAAAAGVSLPVGIGGALFLASDLLIGVGAAGMGFAGRDVAVMATYAVAQALITTGWVTAAVRAEQVPVGSAG